MDFGPDVPGGAMFAFVAAMSGHLRGLSVAAGGAGRVSDALHKIAVTLGVTVNTSTEVSEILVERGRAVAVKLKSGRTIGARLVVAGVTPRRLFGGLVAEERLPPSFRRQIASFRYGPSTFIVHLALDRPLDWRAAEDLWRFNYVHIGGETEQVARTYSDCLSGMLPERPVLVVSQTTSVDPSRAPPGKHVVRIHVRTVPFAIAGDSAGRIEKRDWKEAAEPYADRLIDLLEEHAPNVRKVTMARHVVTPPEIQADNSNLVGGDCVSGSHHLDQNFLNRPIRGWSRYGTPIRNLYMVGASTWPGGGVHGGSGYLLAQRLLR
jgi:phytoene dehydrogenase-like protein